MPKKIRLAALAIVGLAAIGALAWEIESRLGPDLLTVTPKGSSSLTAARRFSEYGLYSAGPSFRGLPLNAVDRTLNRVRGVTIELSFLYGSCDIRLWKGKADGGCSLPLTIQKLAGVQDEHRRLRHLRAHRRSHRSRRPWQVPRPVPPAQADHGTTTIVIQGGGRRFLLATAHSLRGVNNSVRPSENLPKPARAIDGSLEC